MSFLLSMILYALGGYLYSNKNRRNVTFAISLLIPVIFIIIYKEKTQYFGAFFTPLIFSLVYVIIKNIYISELRREPVIPNRFGFIDYEHNRYADGADFLFMILVVFIPIVLSILINLILSRTTF